MRKSSFNLRSNKRNNSRQPAALPSYRFEQAMLSQGYDLIIGCDEAGRGCLVGPVVAAAVVLPDFAKLKQFPWYKDIRDSKLLSPEKRFMLEKLIRRYAVSWGIGVVSPKAIDRINIHHASLKAMRLAVKKVRQKISHGTKAVVLVDGKFVVPDLECDQQPIIKGDQLAVSISTASILAKTFRDRLMLRWHKKFPQYAFDRHKGYATSLHRQMVARYGVSIFHRQSFVGRLTARETVS